MSHRLSKSSNFWLSIMVEPPYGFENGDKISIHGIADQHVVLSFVRDDAVFAPLPIGCVEDFEVFYPCRDH